MPDDPIIRPRFDRAQLTDIEWADGAALASIIARADLRTEWEDHDLEAAVEIVRAGYVPTSTLGGHRWYTTGSYLIHYGDEPEDIVDGEELEPTVAVAEVWHGGRLFTGSGPTAGKAKAQALRQLASSLDAEEAS